MATERLQVDAPDPKAGRVPAARYRKVPVGTWDEPAFRQLSQIPPCGQGLLIYLKTGPHTGAIPGLSRIGRAALAEELDWELEAFDEALAEVMAQGLAKADFKARVVWLPGELQHNRPESLNVVKSWAAAALLVPDCELKQEALAALVATLRTMGDAFLKAWNEASAEPSAKPSAKPSGKATAIQEQEQEQEQEQQKHAGKEGVVDLTGDPAVQTHGKRASRAPTPDPKVLMPDVDGQVLQDWMRARKDKRAGSLTATAAAGLRREAGKLGLTTEQAVKLCAERGWVSIEASWESAQQAAAAILGKTDTTKRGRAAASFASKDYTAGLPAAAGVTDGCA